MAPSVALKTNYACKPIDGATVTIPQRLFLLNPLLNSTYLFYLLIRITIYIVDLYTVVKSSTNITAVINSFFTLKHNRRICKVKSGLD